MPLPINNRIGLLLHNGSRQHWLAVRFIGSHTVVHDSTLAAPALCRSLEELLAEIWRRNGSVFVVPLTNRPDRVWHYGVNQLYMDADLLQLHYDEDMAQELGERELLVAFQLLPSHATELAMSRVPPGDSHSQDPVSLEMAPPGLEDHVQENSCPSRATGQTG